MHRVWVKMTNDSNPRVCYLLSQFPVGLACSLFSSNWTGQSKHVVFEFELPLLETGKAFMCHSAVNEVHFRTHKKISRAALETLKPWLKAKRCRISSSWRSISKRCPIWNKKKLNIVRQQFQRVTRFAKKLKNTKEHYSSLTFSEHTPPQKKKQKQN